MDLRPKFIQVSYTKKADEKAEKNMILEEIANEENTVNVKESVHKKPAAKKQMILNGK